MKSWSCVVLTELGTQVLEGQALATVMSNKAMALYKLCWTCKIFLLCFQCMLPLWSFKQGRWIFFANGESKSRISLKVFGGH